MNSFTCPWCGAEAHQTARQMRKHEKRDWKCGSFQRKGDEPYQLGRCKLRVAENRIKELESQLEIAQEDNQRLRRERHEDS